MVGVRFKWGLVVGKFCPLHKGHELLIDHARAACEQVTVISYTKPEFDRCGRVERERWLNSLFPDLEILVLDDAFLRAACEQRGVQGRILPDNEAPDDAHREFVGWLCRVVLSHPVDAVFTSEDYGEGFASSLSRYFKETGFSSTPVTHVSVDRARLTVPISGTAIRTAPHRYREFLSPVVRASFVRRMAVLGGESSGKTTLARALAKRLSARLVTEYGRELWERKEGRLKYPDMLDIARTQLQNERIASIGADRWIVCDTSPLTTLFYSLHLFGEADTELHALAETPYDHVVLCAPDFPFVQDGTRQGAQFRDVQHQWYLSALAQRGIPVQLVSGKVEGRVEQVIDRLR